MNNTESPELLAAREIAKRLKHEYPGSLFNLDESTLTNEITKGIKKHTSAYQAREAELVGALTQIKDDFNPDGSLSCHQQAIQDMRDCAGYALEKPLSESLAHYQQLEAVAKELALALDGVNKFCARIARQENVTGAEALAVDDATNAALAKFNLLIK